MIQVRRPHSFANNPRPEPGDRAEAAADRLLRYLAYVAAFDDLRASGHLSPDGRVLRPFRSPIAPPGTLAPLEHVEPPEPLSPGRRRRRRRRRGA